MYFSHITPINFEASGIVVDVRWKTSNHNLPLITIRSGTDKPKHFQHVRIILTPEDIKIGDRFSKKSGTNTCSINEVELKCVK
ncbi:MAG: hypothetical protein COA86_17470 [Kangiella sp.]|nr:MAG: hypothetical protein COA86_17470 [Kangiella sp.]